MTNPWDDLAWMESADCRRYPELGWLKEPDHVGLGEEATMGVVCDRCPVRAACEHFAEIAPMTGGFWAGQHRTPDDHDSDDFDRDAA